MATFFLVEDNRLLNETYRMALETMGHKVIGQAYDGLECVEKIKELKHVHGVIPDIIIMDHQMPIKNGVDTTKELLRIEPELKIIFVSGSPEIKDEAISAGAGAFFSKPIDIMNILASINIKL
jgi:CheY-like chemotaxis protein